jgi:hypothetical protein
MSNSNDHVPLDDHQIELRQGAPGPNEFPQVSESFCSRFSKLYQWFVLVRWFAVTLTILIVALPRGETVTSYYVTGYAPNAQRPALIPNKITTLAM